VHLDGCVEVDGAYYHAPPGWIGRIIAVQWDGLHVRLLDKGNGQLLREHLVQKRGGRRVDDCDRPRNTPKSTLHLLSELTRAGRSVGMLAEETILTSNRPVEDWGKLLGDTAAVTAMLDRLLHHAHVLKSGPRSWRTKLHNDLNT
jgi:hypothetical protein